MDWGLGIGDWGLGIGDWGQSPIPNPQYPFHKNNKIFKYIIFKNYYLKNINYLKIINLFIN